MATPSEPTPAATDTRPLRILAKSIYRELRASGYGEREVMAIAGELLALVAAEVKGRRPPPSTPGPA